MKMIVDQIKYAELDDDANIFRLILEARFLF